jgi:factor associated with neutral sphingomyelinase activation
MLRLQNGKFDAPDRMFNGVKEAWDSVNSNPADLKELIPEFYESNGEFLLNMLDLDMGVRQQNKKRVDNVDLPPWSSSPRDFVQKCREALESDHVSAHLHQWVDLIFGHKQKGQPAVDANNLFYYLTYEGAVDLDSIDDPVQKLSYEVQIREFGQCPKQLFTTPHPARGALGETSDSSNMATGALDPYSSKTSTAPQWIPGVPIEEEDDNVESSSPPPPPYQPVDSISALGNPFAPPPDYTTAAVDPVSTHTAAATPTSTPTLTPTPTPSPTPTPTPTPTTANTTTVSSPHSATSTNISSSALETKATLIATPPSISSNTTTTKPTSASYADVWDRLRNPPSTTPPPSKKIHRSRVTSMCIHSQAKRNVSSYGGNGSGSGNGGDVANLVDAEMLLYSTSEDTSLKLHMYDQEMWSQRRSVQLNSLSLSSCVLRDLPNEAIKAAVVGSWDNHIYVYSVECGRMQQQLVAHDDAVACLAQNKTHLASGSWDSTVKLWSWTPSGLARDPLLTVFDHDTQVNCVELHDSLVLSGGENGTIALHDSRQGDAAIMLYDLDDAVSSMKWCNEGQRFLVTTCSTEDDYGVLQVHDSRMSWGAVSSSELNCPAKCMESNGERVLIGCTDGWARMYAITETESFMEWEMEVLEGEILTTMSLSSHGHLAFGTNGGSACLFNI